MESERVQMLDLERVKSLEKWQKETNVNLVQINGQRKYGGPPDDWQGLPPGEGCEVFISQIPRDAYEDILIPLFSSVGPLWEFRLMMNFSGQNRGFAYAKYGSPALASTAMRLLHGHMLEPGVRLSVRRSTEKRLLCLGELPHSANQEQLLQVLRGFSEGVESVFLKAGPDIEGVSAMVVYSSHHAASMAKKVLIESFKKRFALTISVKWHSLDKTKHEVPPAPLRSPKNPVPPRCVPDGPRAPLLPPRLARSPHPTQGFSRAVGGPTAILAPPPPLPVSRFPCRPPVSADKVSPVSFLKRLCELHGGSPPTYELKYSHAGPNGYLYFTYRVYVPRVALPFTGLVTTLPGPTVAAVQEEARQAAAEHILRSIHRL